MCLLSVSVCCGKYYKRIVPWTKWFVFDSNEVLSVCVCAFGRWSIAYRHFRQMNNKLSGQRIATKLFGWKQQQQQMFCLLVDEESIWHTQHHDDHFICHFEEAEERNKRRCVHCICKSNVDLEPNVDPVVKQYIFFYISVWFGSSCWKDAEWTWKLHDVERWTQIQWMWVKHVEWSSNDSKLHLMAPISKFARHLIFSQMVVSVQISLLHSWCIARMLICVWCFVYMGCRFDIRNWFVRAYSTVCCVRKTNLNN